MICLMKKEKDFWHFDFIPVSKEESERIKSQMENGIPENMFVIRGGRIICGGDEEKNRVIK